MSLEVSVEEARAITLRNLGVDSDKDKTVLEVIDRLTLLQLDSVNVFERAHYMPLFSRLGNYKKTELENLMGGKHPTLIEYWAHEAAIIRTEDYPLYRFRMEQHRPRLNRWSATAENKKLLEYVKKELEANGPMTAGDFEHERAVRKGSWWGWSDVKRGLEYMFLVGDVVSGGRDAFKRLYALPEQILPAEVLNSTISHEDAIRTLLLRAANAYGIATARDLRDYHRFWRAAEIKKVIDELVEAGDLQEVTVKGLKETHLAPKNLDFEIKPGKRTTILSPFDPVCWNRDRIERLFDFQYKIEIYVPEPNRTFGYYTLPILHNRQLVGRIDLKSDRKPGNLLAKASWHETNLKSSELQQLAKALTKHLETVKTWQGLSETIIEPKGNLAELLG